MHPSVIIATGSAALSSFLSCCLRSFMREESEKGLTVGEALARRIENIDRHLLHKNDRTELATTNFGKQFRTLCLKCQARNPLDWNALEEVGPAVIAESVFEIESGQIERHVNA
jgi:hypothetical protein